MENANNEQQENKGMPLGCIAQSCLIFVLIVIGLVILAIIIFKIIEHIPETEDTQSNGNYTVTLQSLGSPIWPFGPQDGQIILEKDDETISEIKFVLRNDGKNMSEYNWDVEWQSDKVIVTIIGEEQNDEIFILSYNGMTMIGEN